MAVIAAAAVPSALRPVGVRGPPWDYVRAQTRAGCPLCTGPENVQPQLCRRGQQLNRLNCLWVVPATSGLGPACTTCNRARMGPWLACLPPLGTTKRPNMLTKQPPCPAGPPGKEATTILPKAKVTMHQQAAAVPAFLRRCRGHHPKPSAGAGRGLAGRTRAPPQSVPQQLCRMLHGGWPSASFRPTPPFGDQHRPHLDGARDACCYQTC